MNPQDPNQPDTQTPDTSFGQPSNDDATPSISADFGTSSSTTPDADAAALQAIESLESESTTPLPSEPPVVAPVEPATPVSAESEPQVAGVSDAKPFQSSYTAAPAATPEPAPVTPVEASAAGLAAAAGAQAGQSLGSSQSVPTPASAQANTGEPKKKSKLVLIIAIVLLAVVAGVAGYFVWQSTQTVTIPLETTTETGGDLPGGDGVQVNP